MQYREYSLTEARNPLLQVLSSSIGDSTLTFFFFLSRFLSQHLESTKRIPPAVSSHIQHLTASASPIHQIKVFNEFAEACADAFNVMPRHP